MAKKKKTSFDKFLSEASEWGKENPGEQMRGLKSNLARFDRESKKARALMEVKAEKNVKEALSREFSLFKKKGFRSIKGLKAYRLRDFTDKLRAELKRQTEISLSYINADDVKDMESLRNRFINWATNPTEEERKKGIKLKDNKSHERFVIKDQSRKLEGNLARIVADEVGAFGFIWHNRRDIRVVGNPNGLYKKGTAEHGDHWEREGKLYLIENSKALKKGLIKPTKEVKMESELSDGRPSQAIGCRCWAEYLYRLGDIPERFRDCLTEKGKAEIE